MSAREQRETSVAAVYRLAWPVMVSMLSYTAMSAIDTLFVSRLGTAPLAAVGLAAIVVFFTQSFGAGLMGGVRVLVSQATGARDTLTAARLGWQVLWLALPLGVAMSLMSLEKDFHIWTLFQFRSFVPDQLSSTNSRREIWTLFQVLMIVIRTRCLLHQVSLKMNTVISSIC